MTAQITIIVLFYNQERYVSGLLENIREANRNVDAKVVIVDDCSTDNTLTCVEKWLEIHREISWKVIKNPLNLGISGSILKAIEVVDTKWIKCHAGDDLFSLTGIDEFDAISKLYNPDKTLIMSAVNIINEANEVVGYRDNPSQLTFSKWFIDVAYYTNPLLSFSLLAGPNVYKNAITAMYYRNVEDWPLLMYAVKSDMKFKLVEKKLVDYRIHEKSIMAHTRSKSHAMTDHQKAYEEEIIGILKENLRFAPTMSSRYGAYIQILTYKYRSTNAATIIRFLKLLNIKYLIFRVLILLRGKKV
ncbi:glycosyltransferase family 2 protein [Luminiphilus sp.]|nr:glycosyltransferase family 2 protein [Luminiphilus sp.]